MKYILLIPMLLLSGCSWFHHKQPPAPEPTLLLVNGAPAGSIVLIDGTQAGAESIAGKPQLLTVEPGTHTVEVKVRDKIAYRESTYVAPGEKHTVVVLSGNRGE